MVVYSDNLCDQFGLVVISVISGDRGGLVGSVKTTVFEGICEHLRPYAWFWSKDDLCDQFETMILV